MVSGFGKRGAQQITEIPVGRVNGQSFTKKLDCCCKITLCKLNAAAQLEKIRMRRQLLYQSIGFLCSLLQVAGLEVLYRTRELKMDVFS